MRNKFSFDLRQKLGNLIVDSKQPSRETDERALDSPPPEPKSVRPPLSPQTDIELRAACADILQNFKPSHLVYEEQKAQKGARHQQWDFTSIQQLGEHGENTKTSSKLAGKLSSKDKPPRSMPVGIASEQLQTHKARYGLEATVELPRLDGSNEVQAAGSIAARRPGHSMNPDLPELVSVGGPRPSHARSASNLTSSSSNLARSESVARSRNVGTSMLDTTRSTPKTDITDYPPWTTSTAPTSAAITPARDSKHASSLALQSSQDAGSVPILQKADAEWMRKELEKHKKLQEARAQQEAQEQLVASVLAETKPNMALDNTNSTARKQVPRPCSDSKSISQSRHALARSESRNRPQVLRSASTKESLSNVIGQDHEPESSPIPGRDDRVARGVKSHFRPSSALDKHEIERDASQPPSRARSLTRRVQEYIRPGTSRSQKGSIDLLRGNDRRPSTDSFQSNESALSPPALFSPGERQSSHGRDGSDTSINRPGSASSDNRGRTLTRDSQRKPAKRPPVNLNRELPPLPSVDLWKPVELERPKHIASLSIRPNTDSTKAKKGKKHRPPALNLTAAQTSNPLNYEVVIERNTHAESFSNPPVITQHTARTGGKRHPESKSHEFLNMGRSESTDAKQGRRQRSRSIHADYPPEMAGRLKNGNLAQGLVGEDAEPTHSSGPRNAHARLTTSRQGRSAPQLPLDTKVSTSRKLSNNDYNRMYQNKPHNLVQLNSTPRSRDVLSSQVLGRDGSIGAVNTERPLPALPALKEGKTKRKWWQARPKKNSTWMDHVVDAGSNSGVILVDHVASAPIVRY